MEVVKMLVRGVLGEGRHPFSFFAPLFASLLAGCATQDPNSNAPEPGSGVAEYRQITKEALAAVDAALDSLNSVSTQSNPCPPKLIATFSQEVQQLQIDSLPIRARAQAIQARGDAYFAAWSESIARIKDPQIRASAEHFHPELEQCFSKIKFASQQGGGAFKLFLAGLRKLRVQLEKEPSLTQDDATKELVRSTREHGEEVVRELGVIRGGLQAITGMLTPGKSMAAN
jgi:hypothetical protein